MRNSARSRTNATDFFPPAPRRGLDTRRGKGEAAGRPEWRRSRRCPRVPQEDGFVARPRPALPETGGPRSVVAGRVHPPAALFLNDERFTSLNGRAYLLDRFLRIR